MKYKIRRHLILLKHYKQRTDYSCGLVCLRMLLERFECDYTESFLKNLIHSKMKIEEGMDEVDIQYTTKKLGFKCKIYNYMSFTNLINKLNKNIPIMVGFRDHWQIIIGYDEKYILIVDPNYDKIKRINKKRFLKLWKADYNQALEIK